MQGKYCIFICYLINNIIILMMMMDYDGGENDDYKL